LASPKKILLDFICLQSNLDGKFNGGGEYAKIIFNELLLNSDKIIFYGFIDSSLPLNEDVEHYQKTYNLNIFDIKKVKLGNIISENHITTIYSPLPYKFQNLNLKNTRFIGTIHGLRDLELIDPQTRISYTSSYFEKLKIYIKILFPNLTIREKTNYYNKLITQKGFEFITVSNHSKYSILSYLDNAKKDNISVYYSPNTTNSLKDYTLIDGLFPSLRSNRFFLLVSGNRWIKNNARAIFALDELFSSNDLNDFKVVLTGVSEDLPFFKKIKNSSRFLFLDYVSNNELSHLYKHCYSLIYPSLNEGFGYPPIEAMYYNKPVLASPYTSITEICGDAALYFNPLSIKEIKSRILMILDNQIYQLQVDRSKIRYKEIKKIQDLDLQNLVSFITK